MRQHVHCTKMATSFLKPIFLATYGTINKRLDGKPFDMFATIGSQIVNAVMVHECVKQSGQMFVLHVVKTIVAVLSADENAVIMEIVNNVFTTYVYPH